LRPRGLLSTIGRVLDLNAAFARVLAGGRLDADEAAAVFEAVMRGAFSRERLAALLGALAARGETAEELLGAARAMRAHVTPIRPTRRDLLDTCGTGGSGIRRRNVSTAAAIVVAACGVAVAKHGNRAASSRCGSADVLEALGVDVEAPPATVARCIDTVGIGFLFARALHPAMAHAAPVRRALGVRTIFNLLGPLTNPAFATAYAMGVFDPARVADMAQVLGRLGARRALVFHGFRAGIDPGAGAPAGVDDVSLEGRTLVAEWDGHAVSTWVLEPEDLGLSRHRLSDLAGGEPAENARALTDVLNGRGTAAYREAVLAAAALGLLAASDHPRADLPRLVTRAEAAITSGAAAEVLDRLRAASRHRDPGRKAP